MDLLSLLILKYKSIIRHPLWSQTIIMKFIGALYIFSLLSSIYFLGLVLVDIYKETIQIQNVHSIVSISIVLLFIVDLILKFLFINPGFKYVYLYRLPGSDFYLKEYYVLKEIFSIWNIYLIILLSPLLIKVVLPACGILFILKCFICIFLLQTLNSGLAYCFLSLKHRLFSFSIFMILCGVILLLNKNNLQFDLKKIPFILPIVLLLNIILFRVVLSKSRYERIESAGRFLKGVFSLSYGLTFEYLSINLKTIIRSPFLRLHFIKFLVMLLVYFFIIVSGKYPPFLSFILKILLFNLYVLFFNQYLISTVSSFFDHLGIVPDFKYYLKAKYIEYVLFSLITFILFSILLNKAPNMELLGIIFYCIGPVTLLSFIVILLPQTSLNLYRYQSWSNTPAFQVLAIIAVFFISVSLVIAIHFFFSEIILYWFMILSGALWILFSGKWLNFLLRHLWIRKYAHMEIFRK